ncbi:MAG: sigma 54-interacting transcriptional regulator, partial [Bacteriovoracia bacterium]
QIYLSGANETSELIAKDGKPVTKEVILAKGTGLAGHVIRTKRAYFSNNVKRDPLLSSFKYEKNVTSELAVPMNINGSVLGSINILSSEENRDFSEVAVTIILDILKNIQAPLANMKMYLMAKNLNRELMKKIEDKEKELTQKNSKNLNEEILKVDLIGNSEAFQDMVTKAERIATSQSYVIIQGASGCGKEMMARKIHLNSERSEQPFVTVNCAAIDEVVLEKKLFGVNRGAFTGADQDKEGLLEKAHKGTLVLDCCHELSLNMQAKMLRVIASGEAYRIGSHTPYSVDVRVIGLTKLDLQKETQEGRFHEELFHRLNAMKLEVPSLNDRKEDIRTLAEYYLNNGVARTEMKTLTSVAAEALSQYNWTGNIRELKNVMERVRVMSKSSFIDLSDLPANLQRQEEEAKDASLTSAAFEVMRLEEIEKRHICQTLDHAKGNKTKTAKLLGITVKTLYNKLHNYDMV